MIPTRPPIPNRLRRYLMLLVSVVLATTALPKVTAQNQGEALFQGVTYFHETRTSPRPLEIHLVAVDLTAPGISLAVTPGDTPGSNSVLPRTTSRALREFGWQVAINASFFAIDSSGGLLDFLFPGRDPVDVLGLWVAEGITYSLDRRGFPALTITPDNRVSIGRPVEPVQHAVAGNHILLRDGQIVAYGRDLEPRTAVGIDASGTTLLLVVVDGRQPERSEGVSLPELAAIIREYGGDDALNLDGGGSVTLVAAGEDGDPVVLNRPIDNRIPGRQRPVGTHLGITALPLPAGDS